MFRPIRNRPERWLFTALVALMFAPVVAQGLDRPLASLLGTAPSGAVLTGAALACGLSSWLVAAAREEWGPAAVLVFSILVGVGFGVALGLPVSGVLTVGAAAAASGAVACWLPTRLPSAFDGLLRRRRLLALVYVAAALLSLVQVARVSVFIADPTRTDAQLVPGVEFLEHHSCLTAYVRADELAKARVDNLYLAERWPITVDNAIRPQTPFSPFDIDAFFYPPPFLLLAEILAPWSGDFLAQRAAWFGLNGLLLAFGLGVGARSLGGARWHRPLLLAPLLFGSLPVLTILQVGQAQAAVVVAAILGMLAFEARRPALGGFALALATASKVSPAIFGVVLLVQRRWRALAWTTAFGALLLVLALLAYGSGPMVSWVGYALPRLSSGEAFAEVLGHPESVVLNLSPGGVPFKLALLGVDIGDPWSIARRVNAAFSLVVVVLAVVIGRRRAGASEHRTSEALAWMSLIFLTALRSPFAPGYVAFALLWAITLVSVEVETRRAAVGLVALFVASSALPPFSVTGQVIALGLVEMCGLGLALWLILRRPRAPGRS